LWSVTYPAGTSPAMPGIVLGSRFAAGASAFVVSRTADSRRLIHFHIGRSILVALPDKSIVAGTQMSRYPVLNSLRPRNARTLPGEQSDAAFVSSRTSAMVILGYISDSNAGVACLHDQLVPDVVGAAVCSASHTA
jgi:hypothetical protein